MNSNTAKKIEYVEAMQERAEVITLHMSHKEIEHIAEAAYHLPGNNHSPDPEAFLAQYGEGIASDFA